MSWVFFLLRILKFESWALHGNSGSASDSTTGCVNLRMHYAEYLIRGPRILGVNSVTIFAQYGVLLRILWT